MTLLHCVSLSLLYPPASPSITLTAPSYVIQGDSLTVSCNVTGYPQVDIDITRDSSTLMMGSSSFSDGTNLFEGSVSHNIANVNRSTDEGNYTCLVSISNGTDVVEYSEETAVIVYSEFSQTVPLLTLQQ